MTRYKTKQLNIFILSTVLLLLSGVNYLKAQESVASKIHDLASRYEKTGYNGVVLVASQDKIIGQEAFGYSNNKTKAKNTTTTIFKTESTGKIITAVAIMQLVDKGKIDLSKTIEEYLPHTKIKNADKITLHHLLTHRSGLTSPWERPDFVFKKYSDEEMLDIIETNPLAFEIPGSDYYYSSSGYEILSFIIKKVSGLSFEEYCKKKIFSVAKMKNTHYAMDTLTYFQKGGARPYRWVSSAKYYEYPLNYIQAGGAGGWISCVEDYYKFAHSLLSGKLVSQKAFQLMLTNYTGKTDDQYGYGIEIDDNSMVKGKKIFGHNGGGMGYGCDLFFDTETKTIVVTMLNMFGNSRPVTGNFFSLALGKETETPKKSNYVLLYDKIEEKGIDDFSIHYDECFKAVGFTKTPSAGFLLRFGQGYELLQEPAKRKTYLSTLEKILPEEPYVFFELGIIYLSEKNSAEALKYFNLARPLADKYAPELINELDLNISKIKGGE